MGLGVLGTFHFLCLRQAVKESLFHEEERKLCVHGEGPVPPIRTCVLEGMWPPAFTVLRTEPLIPSSKSHVPGPRPISYGPGERREDSLHWGLHNGSQKNVTH